MNESFSWIQMGFFVGLATLLWKIVGWLPKQRAWWLVKGPLVLVIVSLAALVVWNTTLLLRH